MTMHVEIICKETIKPCFPTPETLKNYKLCSLDHMAPDICIPHIFFYPNYHNQIPLVDVDQRVAVLKNSLSEILTRFFPLAGTINKDGVSVDCDDRGASFTTAKLVDCPTSLTEFLSQEEGLDLKLITQLFLPSGGNIITSSEYPTNCLTNIQATVFEKCGGIVVGVCISHKLVDATAFSFFLKSWADVAAAATTATSVNKLNNNNNNISPDPDFSAASSLLPARDLRAKEALGAELGSRLKKGQFVTRRFVFDGSAITTLRDIHAVTDKKNHARRPPTRVEAVSAFIWKCALMAADHGSNYNLKPSLLTHAVNLRSRAPAPYNSLSQQSIGNLLCVAGAYITAEKRKNLHLPELVDEIRKSVSKIDGEFVKKLITGTAGEALSMVVKHVEDECNCSSTSVDVDYYSVSSWCKLGMYEIDFGWGKPVWVSYRDSSGPIGLNLVRLMDTKCGKGIEAWVTLDEQHMAVLENNQEFRVFASLNPSPLAIHAN